MHTMLFNLLAAHNPGNIWLPKAASDIATEVDWLYMFVTWVTIFFTALIFVLTLVFAVKYRASDKNPQATSHATHSTLLEIGWSAPPMIIALAIFFWGFRGYMNMVERPAAAYEIAVNGKMWSWTYTYPDGTITDSLHIPIGTPIRLKLNSSDVIHDFFIPAFRAKKDVVPGRWNTLGFTATELNPQIENDKKSGFDVYCAEYCGKSHSDMYSKVYVYTKEEFYGPVLEKLRDPTRGGTLPAPEIGANLYKSRGCSTCHSIDGTKGTGPSWKELYMHQGQFDGGGSYTADENYIKESILYPGRHVVAGFGNNMPSYLGQLKDNEIGWIIEYMKTISSHYQATTLNAPGSQPASGPATGVAPKAPASGTDVHQTR